MKKSLKRLVCLIAMAVMFLTGASSASGFNVEKAYALSPGYNGESFTIYYFTDFYPTLSKDILTDEFGDTYNVVMDRKLVGSSQFNALVNSGYFSGINDSTCVVVIDIKLFKPDSQVMKTLFFNLKNVQGCKTVFVSYYPQTDFADSEFISYVDLFVQDNEFESLHYFNERSIDLLCQKNGTVTNTVYLIDGNLVNTSLSGANMDVLCNGSTPFLKIFLQKLIYRLNEKQYGIDYNTYEEIAAELRYNNVKLLVHTTGNLFVDILTWQYYTVDFVEDVMDANTENVCAIGFWAFNSDFYQVLHFIQNSEGYDLPIYAYEIDEVFYDENGLNIEKYISAVDNDAAVNIFNGLKSLLGYID